MTMKPTPTTTAQAARAAAGGTQPTQTVFGAPAVTERERRALEQLSTMLAADLDNALLQALFRFLGRPIKDADELDDMATRLLPATKEGEPGTTYLMDGVPILWAGEIHVERSGTKMSATQALHQLLPQPISAGS